LNKVAPPQYTEFIKYDYYADEVGKQVLNICKNDSFCGSKVSDPEKALRELFSQFVNPNHCQEFFR
jgi:hypothetical protein